MVYYPPDELVLEWYNYDNQSNSSRNYVHDKIVGSIYIVISCIYLAAYLCCIFVICKEQCLRRKPYYRIVIHMGVTDMLQLIFNGIVAGGFTVSGCVDYRLNKVCGGIMNFCWVIFCVMAHLLALNRLIQIFASKRVVNIVFSLRNTRLYLAVIWLYGLAWFAAYMTPDVSVLYSIDSYDWHYCMTPLSVVFYWIEFVQDTLNAACMVIWYTLIFIKLKLKLKTIKHVQIKEEKKEIRVLLQAFIVCLMIILTVIGFFVIPKMSRSKWARFASNLTWLTCSGSNCFVYFLFDSSIKRKFIDIFKMKPQPVAV